MRAALLGAVACGAWAMGAGAATAGAPQLFVERVGPEPAYCPPCVSAWVTGLRPKGTVVLHVTDRGAPNSPFDLKGTECGAGLGFVPYAGTGKGNIDLVASVDGVDTGPFGCLGPFDPGPVDCPPPPIMGVISIAFGNRIAVPVARSIDAIDSVTLHRLLTGDKPGWEVVDVPGRVTPRPIPRVTFDRPVDPGVYRTQVLDKERKVLEVRLVRVEEKKTARPPVKPGRTPAPGKVH